MLAVLCAFVFRMRVSNGNLAIGSLWRNQQWSHSRDQCRGDAAVEAEAGGIKHEAAMERERENK